MKKKKVRFICASMILVAIQASLFCGCDIKKEDRKSNASSEEQVKLRIVGATYDFKALESAIHNFTDEHPNCEIEYEYLQDYENMIEKRLTSEDDAVDMFITNNIQVDSPYYPYALELFSQSDILDLSDTFDGLINNSILQASEDEKKLYAIPFGAEMRGLYVNTTILDSLNIEVPKNKTEFLRACEVLSKEGYIPVQANPGNFGQQFIFPYIVNKITTAQNHDEVYKMINECQEGAAEFFREPLQLVYTLVEENYYNYKYVEKEYGTFLDPSTETMTNGFLNIVEKDGVFTKADDIGKVAFMTSPNSFKNDLDKAKEDYHSKIEYQFILSPVSDEGGFAHISPSKCIAINKNSKNTKWSLKFFDFLFDEKNNKDFCEEYNIISNTTDALECTSEKYGIAIDKITKPEDVTFDYGFYKLIVDNIVAITKSNNPKYMKKDSKGNTTMYEFDHFINELEKSFEAQRTSLK